MNNITPNLNNTMQRLKATQVKKYDIEDETIKGELSLAYKIIKE